MNRFAHALGHRFTAALVLPVLALGLAGCGAVAGSARQIAALRIIDATPDAGALDVYANSTALAYNLGFGTVSSYVVFAPGAYTFSAHAAGSASVVASTRGSLSLQTQYTLLFGNFAADLQSLLLQDQGQPAPAGQVAVRFIHQATRAGAVDLYLVPSGGSLSTAAPVKAGLVFNTAANLPVYLNVPSGAYTLVVVPAGTVPTSATLPSYSGSVVSYASGSARTIVLLDRPLALAPALQVITAVDYDATAAPS